MRALILASAATVALAPAALAQQNQTDAKTDARPAQEQAQRDQTRQEGKQTKAAETAAETAAADEGEEVQAEAAERPIGVDENLKPEGAGLTWRSDLTEVTPRGDYRQNIEKLRQQRQVWEEQGRERLADIHQGPEFRQAMERLREARQEWAQAQGEMRELEQRMQQQRQQQQAMRRQEQQPGQQQRGITARRMTELRPTTVTCRELTNYDTAFVPGLVYWIDGYVMARNARGDAAVEPVVRMRQDWFAMPADRIIRACADQPDQPAAVVISAQRERMMNEDTSPQSAEIGDVPGPNQREALSENTGEGGRNGQNGTDGQDQQQGR